MRAIVLSGAAVMVCALIALTCADAYAAKNMHALLQKARGGPCGEKNPCANPMAPCCCAAVGKGKQKCASKCDNGFAASGHDAACKVPPPDAHPHPHQPEEEEKKEMPKEMPKDAWLVRQEQAQQMMWHEQAQRQKAKEKAQEMVKKEKHMSGGGGGGGVFGSKAVAAERLKQKKAKQLMAAAALADLDRKKLSHFPITASAVASDGNTRDMYLMPGTGKLDGVWTKDMQTAFGAIVAAGPSFFADNKKMRAAKQQLLALHGIRHKHFGFAVAFIQTKAGTYHAVGAADNSKGLHTEKYLLNGIGAFIDALTRETKTAVESIAVHFVLELQPCAKSCQGYIKAWEHERNAVVRTHVFHHDYE